MQGDRSIADELDAWRAFGAGIFRPARPRLAAALGVATGIPDDLVREALAAPAWRWHVARNHSGLAWRATGHDGAACERWAPGARRRPATPRALWEALATRGVIPDAWVSGDAKRFYGGGLGPPTMEAAVALAADPEGIAICEDLAREAARRLAPWLERRTPRRVRWWMLDAIPRISIFWEDTEVYGPGGEAVGRAMWAATDAVGGAFGYRRPAWTAAGAAVAEGAPAQDEIVGGVASIVSAAGHWRAAVAAGAVSRVTPPIAFASCPDPFEPLLAIWARGYGLFDIGSAVTLVAPPVGVVVRASV